MLFPDLLARTARLAEAGAHLGRSAHGYVVSIVGSAPFNSTEGNVIVAPPGGPYQVGFSERGGFAARAEVATEEEACHIMWRTLSVSTPGTRPHPIDPDVLHKGMRRWAPYRARFLASDPAASARLLARLGTHRDFGVRWVVARHETTPPEVLAALAGDAEFGVRWGVAGNVQTPPAALAGMVGDPEVAVGVNLAANPQTPVPALRVLAGSEEAAMRREVARNPHTPPAELERLAADPEDSVALWVGANPSAPPAAQAVLAVHPSGHVRSFARPPG